MIKVNTMGTSRKGRNKAISGFTLAEILIALGILLILMAVGVIAGTRIIRNTRQSHLDKRAEAVYYAAQSRMMELFVTQEKVEEEITKDGKTVTVSVVDELYNGNKFDYNGKELGYVTSDDSGSIVFKDNTLSSEVGGSNVIIEYDPISLDVYAVILSDTPDKGGTSLAGLTGQGSGAPVRGTAQDRIDAYKGYVGYYAEGDNGALGAKSDSGLSAGAWIVNGRDLLGIVKITVDKETKDLLTNLTYKLTVRGPKTGTGENETYTELNITGRDIVWQNYQGGPDNNYLNMTGAGAGSGQRHTVNDGSLQANWFGDVSNSADTYGLIGYIKLDSLDKDYRLSDLLAAGIPVEGHGGEIKPGQDISISIKVWDSDSADGLSQQTRSASAVSNTENSLFGDFDYKNNYSVAEIIYPRHLQNLDFDYAKATAAAADGGSASTKIAAVLAEDINWSEDANKYNGSVRNFTPISNNELKSFTGERIELNTNSPYIDQLAGIVISSADSVTAVDPQAGNDAEEASGNLFHVIEGIKVDTADSYALVGTNRNIGLFGNQPDITIANLVLRNFELKNNVVNQATGMLAGKLTGTSVVKNVFAYNKKEDAVSKGITGSDSTGGLIGEIEGGAIDGCVVKNLLVTSNGNTGGFAGKIKSCEVNNVLVFGEDKFDNYISSQGNSSAYAGGLAGSLEAGTVKGSVVRNVKVNSAGGAGSFAGSMNGCEISDALSYNEEQFDNDIIIQGSGNAGGFIGATEGGSITGCGTAMYVEGGTAAGGFIGASNGTTINKCYAGGHTIDGGKYSSVEDHATPGRINVVSTGAAGGFIGSSTGSTVSNSYSTCSAKGATRGGFIGTSAGGNATNCYATGMVIFEGETSAQAGGFIGSGSISPSNDYYFEIINKADDKYVLGIGGTDENPDGIKAIDSIKEADGIEDRSAYTYNNSVMVAGNQFQGREELTKKYDEGLPAQYPMKFAYELANESYDPTQPTDYLFFAYEHHGDWPRPETNIINNASNNLGAFNKKGSFESFSPFEVIKAMASSLGNNEYIRALAEAVITDPITTDPITTDPITTDSTEPDESNAAVTESSQEEPAQANDDSAAAAATENAEAADSSESGESVAPEENATSGETAPAEETSESGESTEASENNESNQPSDDAGEQNSNTSENPESAEAVDNNTEEKVDNTKEQENAGTDNSSNESEGKNNAAASGEQTEINEPQQDTNSDVKTEEKTVSEGDEKTPAENTPAKNNKETDIEKKQKEAIEEAEKNLKEMEEENPEEAESLEEFSLTDEEHGITIYYNADADIPEGAEIRLVDIASDSEDYDYDKLTSDAAEALELVPEEIASFKAIDISIIYDGEEIQPKAPVRVEIKAEKLYENNELYVDDVISAVHMKEDEPQVIETTVTNEKEEEGQQEEQREEQKEEVTTVNEAAETVSFDADGFSVYVLVQPVMQKQVKASDGNVYEITVDYDNASGIPAGAELVVNEILQDSDDYKGYMDECMGELDSSDEEIWFARAFDIYFFNPETEEHYQPSKNVSVSIKLMQDDVNADREMSVVHFGDSTEIVDCAVDEEAVTFGADSFSVYVIIGHVGDGEVKTPRVEFHFLDGETTNIGSGLFSAAPYSFANKAGTLQTTEIIKNGETLESVKNPPNKTIEVNGESVEQYFFGWYVVNFDSSDNGQVRYTWTDDPDQILFDKPISITPPTNGRVGENITWTMNGVSGTGVLEDDGCCHVYLAPIYEDYYFINFHIGTKEDSTLRNSIQLRRLVVLGNDESVTVHIGDVKASSTDSTRKVFAGWETATPTYETKNCYYSVDATTGEEVNSPGSTSGYFVTFNKSDFIDERIDLYPVFAEARWINFNTGKSGNNAKYIPAQYILTSDSENSYYISSLPGNTEAVRSGYDFMGWYADATLDNEGNITNLANGAVKIANADGSLVNNYTKYDTDGTTVLYKIVDGKLYLYKELDSLTLYALWQEYTDTTYKVIIWKQKITDSKTATADQKTYDYQDSFLNIPGRSSSTLDQLDIAAYKAYTYTGFHYARCDMSTSRLASDGTSVVNVYYDRDLMTINFVNIPGGTTNYTYSETTAQTGNNLYGYVDGEYVPLTYTSVYVFTIPYNYILYTETPSNGDSSHYGIYNNEYIQIYYSNGTWYRTRSGRWIYTYSNPYTGYVYSRENGSVYTGTRYTRNGNNYTPTTSTNGTQYANINGVYIQLTRTNGYEYRYRDANNNEQIYEGRRYTRTNVTSLQWTGLYGQTFAQNGYSWDTVSMYSWNESSDGNGTGQTMLYAFTQTSNPYNLYYRGNAGTWAIYHYRQQLDGSYTQDDRETALYSGTSSQVNFNFTNKFDGFTVKSYSTTAEGFVTSGGTHNISVGSSVSLNSPFYVYHTRNSYTLTMNVNYPNDVSLTFPSGPSTDKEYTVLFGDNFSRFSSNGPDYFEPNIPENYTFDGWFEDKTGTKPFNFNQTMPSANKIIYAKWSPLRYRIMIDPNGGEIDHVDHGIYQNGGYKGYEQIRPFRNNGSGYNRSQATYVNAAYGTVISEYDIHRNYVPISDAAAATYTGTIYYYLNTQYNENDGSGLPSDLRNALYITEPEIDEYYNFYYDWTTANVEGGYITGTTVLGKEAWKSIYVSSQKYREKYPGENYQFLGWYKLDSQGNPGNMPYDFTQPVREPFTIKGFWRLDGGYSVEYNPQFNAQDGESTVSINGELTQWRDPAVTDSNYADGAETEILQQPTGITVNGQESEDYIFRGWRLVSRTVDGQGNEVFTPLENNVYYDPGDEFIIKAEYADSQGKIYMQAYYEQRDASYRRPHIANLTLDANTGFITLDGTNELTTNTDLSDTWEGVGNVSATVSTPTGDTEFIEFGDIQSNAEIHLHRYATNLQTDAAGNNLTDSKNYFAHENGYLLLGFDDSSDEGDYIATYPADALITVQRTDAKTIYAVWEPLVYLNFVNNTNKGDVTFGLSSTDSTTLQVLNVKNGIYDRTPLANLNNITVAEGETLKLAIPYGAGKNIAVSGENELGPGTMLIWNSDAASNPAEGFVENGEEYSFTETPIVDPTGITITFTSKQHDRTIVLHDNYGEDETHEVYLANDDVSTILPTTNTRLGYQFKGWARTRNATSAEYSATNNYTISNLDAFFGTETIKDLYAVWEARAEAATIYAYKEVKVPGDTTKDFNFTVSFAGGCKQTNGTGNTINIPRQSETIALKSGEYLKIFSEKYVGQYGLGILIGEHPYLRTTITKYDKNDVQIGSPKVLYWEHGSNVAVNYNNPGVNYTVTESDYSQDYYDTSVAVAAEITQGSITPSSDARSITWRDSDAGGTAIFTNERQTVDVKVEKELVTESESPVLTNFNFHASYIVRDEVNNLEEEYNLDDFTVTSGSYTYIRKVPVGVDLVIKEEEDAEDIYETEVTASSLTATIDGTFDETENSFTFKVPKQDELTVKFKNTLKSYKVTFYKVDGNEEPGVEAFFTLSHDSSVLGTLLYPNQTTGVFYPRPNMLNTKMYVGEYKLSETWVESGFMKLEDDITITISGDDDGKITSDDRVHVKVKEERVNGEKEFKVYIINSNGAEIDFKKIDAFGNVIKNEGEATEAWFALYETFDDALNAVVTDTEAGTTFDDTDDKIATLTITTGTGSNEVKEQKPYATQDDEGEVKFEIPAGTYFMKEVKAPEGYTFDNTEHADYGVEVENDEQKQCIYRIVVGTDAASDAGITLEENEEFRIQRMKDATTADETLDVKEYGIMNISKKNERIVLKKEASTGLPLTGATFDIVRPDRSYYKKNLSSGAAGGFFIADLPYGYYYLYESAAPSGYAGSGKYYKLTIDENGKTLTGPADSIEAYE